MTAAFDPLLHIDDVTAIVVRASRRSLEWFRRPMVVDNKLADGASERGEAVSSADSAAAPFDPVTEADRAVEHALRAALSERFPDHEILGEEGGVSGGGEWRWIIDPIDGTRAFITGQPMWGTLLGLRNRDVMVAGWLHNPVLDHTYVGSARGATLIERGIAVPIHTRAAAELAEAIVLTTHPGSFAGGPEADGFARLDRATRMVRYSGDCMNYALLASGFADLVVESGLQPYDIAALIPIVEQAGGVITGLDGSSPIDGGYVVAAASVELHDAAMAVLAVTRHRARRVTRHRARRVTRHRVVCRRSARSAST